VIDRDAARALSRWPVSVMDPAPHVLGYMETTPIDQPRRRRLVLRLTLALLCLAIVLAVIVVLELHEARLALEKAAAPATLAQG
jgi:hypothetical protein